MNDMRKGCCDQAWGCRQEGVEHFEEGRRLETVALARVSVNARKQSSGESKSSSIHVGGAPAAAVAEEEEGGAGIPGASTAPHGTATSPAHHLDPHPPENDAKTKPPTNQMPFVPHCMPLLLPWPREP